MKFKNRLRLSVVTEIRRVGGAQGNVQGAGNVLYLELGDDYKRMHM